MNLFWAVSIPIFFGLVVGVIGIYFAERERRQHRLDRRDQESRQNQARA
jgi:hypothetical protein